MKTVTNRQAFELAGQVAEKLMQLGADGKVVQTTIEQVNHPFWSDLVKHFGQKSGVMIIDRTTPFNPAEFIGDSWTIEEEDKRSLALTEVDFDEIRLETTLKKGETSINGEEKLKRLEKAGHIRLDAKVFQTLWKDKTLIPESWKKMDGYTIYFNGTILRGPNGSRCVLCLYWSGGEWRWDYCWLALDWDDCSPSAVYPQVSPQN